MLKPADVVLLAKLLTDDESASSVELAAGLGWSQPQAHRALKRLQGSRLVAIVEPPAGQSPGKRRVNRRGAYELMAFGVPYVFPAEPGRLVRGVPTAVSAPVLARHFRVDPEPVVWPHPAGQVRGMAVEPLHPCAPMLAETDGPVYELLALVDAIRLGRARERNLARTELERRLT